MARKILVVDDNRIDRQLLRTVLCEDYEVLEAATPKEALGRLRHPDANVSAVVLNVATPSTEGFDLIATMRADATLARIPIIASATSYTSGIEAKSLSLGASDFVAKPYDAKIVKHRLKNVIRFIEAANDAKALRTEKEALRISEERYRIAASAAGRVTAYYDIKTRTYHRGEKPLTSLPFDDAIDNMPHAFIDEGVIAKECIAEYLAFHDKIESGKKLCCTDIAIRVDEETYRWCHCDATVIFDDENQPAQAIIVYDDITEQREKEAVYQKWRQSLHLKALESYTLLRCNLSQDASFDSVEGSLLNMSSKDDGLSFNARAQKYARQHIHPSDREAYLALVNSDTLLANYHRDRRLVSLEFREILSDDTSRWLLLTIELVEYPNSSNIEAYMMYEDIDASKTALLKTKSLAEIDSLTGVFNRAAFEQQVTTIIANNKSLVHAFLILDIDGFKQLNDTFGHAEGDQALIDIASSLRSALRHGDLLGRLGGDEFVIFMRDVPYDAAIEKKAAQICALTRRMFSSNVQISASIGIAVYPRDGAHFHALYRSADLALYDVKASCKDNFAFFNGGMKPSRPVLGKAPENAPEESPVTQKTRRMLIVDDSPIDRMMLANIFKDDFVVEHASTGNEALMRLRHYGAGMSIVLLDLTMPGMDGLAVLEEISGVMATSSIPVIIVSGQDERETSLRALKAGAVDYVTKPVDVDVIRLRVQAAVSKAESERLQAQNSYYLLQSEEEARYRTVLESTGTVVIEHDWTTGAFSYDSSISQHIAGTFDNRRLWQILLSDMVASTADIQTMQELVYNIASDRARTDGSLMALMKTPAGKKQWFRMRVFKRTDEFQLTTKMILTYVNVNSEVLLEQELHYRAERDDVTGLYNRKTFFEKAAEMVVSHTPGYYVMACFDIDNFKIINDQYGTAKGDETLRFVSNVFQTGFEKMGGVVCRIAADNFAVLYPARFMNSDEVARMRDEAVVLDGSIAPMSFSIGRYVVKDTSLSVESMYDKAFLAGASIKGRFDVHIAEYDESMRSRLLRVQEIVSEMKPALEQGQFEVWLQPQYNHTTGAIIGAEALARWRHPTRGLVSPGEFIPIFERNGFIYELDKYMWEQVCALLRRWLDAGRSPLPVSVNVSRYDMLYDDICNVIVQIARTYEIPTDLLRLEITESAFADDAGRVIRIVKRLIDLGFTVEIDDFGSGYSSLNTLKDVPAQILKMDMRFLESTDDSSRGGCIMESVVHMSKWLGMSVIAEGVETKRQADYLNSIGCNHVQGFLYAKPLPVPEYEELEKHAAIEQQLLTVGAVENLDNNEFWDPHSIDALIFNAYVGGACVFQWSNGHIELMRANDKYAKMVGGEDCTIADALDLAWDDHLDAVAMDAVRTAIASVVENGDDATCEVVFFDLPNFASKAHLRITFRIIARTGDRHLFYAAVENVTAQREADEQLRFLNDVAHNLLAQQKADASIRLLLRKLLDYFDGSRAYVFELNEEKTALISTYARYAPDFPHFENQQQVLDQTTFKFWLLAFKTKRPVVIDDVSALPESRANEKQYLEDRGIRSLVAVPLRQGDELVGLIGVDNPARQQDRVDRLMAIGDYVSVTLNRRDLIAKTKSDNETLLGLMNDAPGGFARMQVMPHGQIVTKYVNASFCRIRAMSPHEILAADCDNSFNSVHPDDKELVQSTVKNMIETGKTCSLTYRLRRSDGTYVPLNVFGRVTNNEAGEVFINAYFAELDGEEKTSAPPKSSISAPSPEQLENPQPALRAGHAAGDDEE